MDMWRSSMDDLHGRLQLTTFMDDFIVPGRLRWSSVVLLSMYIVPSWGFLVQTALLTLDDAFGRTRVGLIFLLPYQLPLCARGHPGYYCDFKKVSLFVSYSRHYWLVSCVDPISQRNCHMSIFEWRMSFQWPCCWGL